MLSSKQQAPSSIDQKRLSTMTGDTEYVRNCVTFWSSVALEKNFWMPGNMVNLHIVTLTIGDNDDVFRR